MLRVITSTIPDLNNLGLPEVLKEIVMAKRGLVIMVGATGSGKSTTLAIVLLTAVIQVVVHLVYFLHMDRSPEQRNSVAALIFSALVIVLLVGLSLWIMFSIHAEMMAK